jgi:ribonuclease Z
VAFNKTRAEGKDGRKGRSMELKSRKLNPINTICYVQVRDFADFSPHTTPHSRWSRY